MLLFAEVPISVTTTYGYEDVHGFPYPENYLEIGLAMLSLVRCYQLATDGPAKRTRRPIAAVSVVHNFWNNNNYSLLFHCSYNIIPGQQHTIQLRQRTSA